MEAFNKSEIDWTVEYVFSTKPARVVYFVSTTIYLMLGNLPIVVSLFQGGKFGSYVAMIILFNIVAVITFVHALRLKTDFILTKEKMIIVRRERKGDSRKEIAYSDIASIPQKDYHFSFDIILKDGDRFTAFSDMNINKDDLPLHIQYMIEEMRLKYISGMTAFRYLLKDRTGKSPEDLNG